MKLDEVVGWYQKKIGTYDKQQWEKTVEQRILNGFTNVPLKNTKLRTEFIDVDLVRGSTFPKAKAKQSLLTVLRLALIRFLFLPLYAKWWVTQTSPKIFSLLLSLYTLQMFNWAVYSYNINRINTIKNDSDTCSDDDKKSDVQFVSLTELLIPIALSLILSLIHSQIVATASSTLPSSEQRKRDIVQPNRKKRERKKRKKHIRSRPLLNLDVKQSLQPSDTKKSCLVVGRKIFNELPFIVEQTPLGIHEKFVDKLSSKIDKDCTNEEVRPQIRKRNVIWDSPIKSQVNCNSIEHELFESKRKDAADCDKKPIVLNGIASDEISNDSTENNENVILLNENHVTDHTVGDDDGFESLNGKSSSGDETITVNVIAASQSNGGDNEKIANVENMYLSVNDDSNVESNIASLLSSSKVCDKPRLRNKSTTLLPLNTTKFTNKIDTSETDEDRDECESQPSPILGQQFTEGTTLTTEWIGITTNSEECSYSSADNSGSQIECSENGGGVGECDYFTPTVILNSSCGIGDRISCTIWDGRETKKAEMSVLDISSTIIERVEAIPETCDYVYIGLAFSIVLSLVPAFCRLCEAVINSSELTEINFLDMPALLLEKTSFSYDRILRLAFGESSWQKTVLFIDFLLRFFLTFLFFFLLAVAERTFKQRFLYAKLFSHLTSSRRARKSELPHFRLNKVRNIKTWLSVRSYLKRRGPQRSVDVIVSAAFIVTLLLLAFLSVEWLKDSVQLQSQHNLEALIWSCALGCFLLRFMTLGTKINRKYRSISVLITEQINLYLQIEQNPHNKDELMVSNSVLKLAADLLKELESPFKISGLSANPYLYTTVKVVILSALSGVLSEMLGFKLKLHKIKIK